MRAGNDAERTQDALTAPRRARVPTELGGQIGCTEDFVTADKELSSGQPKDPLLAV